MAEHISVVGLGKLGLCLAACLAESGFETLGVDIDKGVADAVNLGVAPWFEPGLDDLVARHGGKRLRATLHHSEAIEKTDITFLLLPTPSDQDGRYSNQRVESALKILAEAYGQSKKGFHTFVISSTVVPCSTDDSFIPIIERYSGKVLNKDFAVCYNPEFVALGNAINGFLYPDIVVIGESSSRAGETVLAALHRLFRNRPLISRMSIVSAEVAKLCLNAYITTKISFVNAVANLCERLPGTDVDAITRAIGADRRISPYYFQAGPSYGGPCFPRDNRAYVSVADRFNAPSDILQAADRINTLQNQHLIETVLREVELTGNKTVGILGLAFTPNTPVITASPVVSLIEHLLKHGVRIAAYDPLAIDNARTVFGTAVEYLPGAAECLEVAGVCVVTLRSPDLREAVETFRPIAPLTLIDCWRMIDHTRLDNRIKYIPMGRYRNGP